MHCKQQYAQYRFGDMVLVCKGRLHVDQAETLDWHRAQDFGHLEPQVQQNKTSFADFVVAFVGDHADSVGSTLAAQQCSR
jgi:hypothetical protein